MAKRKRIIGLAGKAGSGKDTVADYIFDLVPGKRDYRFTNGPLGNVPNCKRLLFAKAIKEAALAMFSDAYGVTPNDVYGPSANRSMVLGDLTTNDGDPLTLRHVLQTLGTEWGRDCIHKDLWVNLTLRAAKVCSEEVVVITDCRFNNEFKAIRDAGGELWHIDRPGAGLKGDAGIHPSELDLSGYVLTDLRTAHVQNTGTLTDLRDAVKRAFNRDGGTAT